MKRRQRGFGLHEVMIALALGLMLLAAASQVFVAAHQSWQLLSTAAHMQDEARLVLLRMAQDIRMAGMFGCLRLQPGDFAEVPARQAFGRPLQVEGTRLSLVVAELPGQAGAPDWFLHTDCLETVRVSKQRQTGYPVVQPVSRYTYQLQGTKLTFKRADSKAQPLLENVREMRLERVQMAQGERIDIALTLYEPMLRLEQQHELSVAIRNPVPAS